MRPERLFCKRVNRTDHMVRDPGSREGVAKFECFFLERYSCTSFDLCEGALS